MKTSELTPPALDWVVAKCKWPDDIGNTVPFHHDGSDYAPSRKWAHGGPIIERELMQISGSVTNNEPRWFALRVKDDKSGVCKGHGPTPLIAAMRCYVASRLGDDVEIPEELQGE